MDIKFVSFPFKIKSSAIKILTAKTNVNLYFIYEYLLFLNLISEEHKRHYISEIEPLHIVVPCLVIQHKIAEILQSIDKQIHCCPEKFYHKVGCSTEPASGTLTGVVG